jgi:HEAT repeat protein
LTPRRRPSYHAKIPPAPRPPMTRFSLAALVLLAGIDGFSRRLAAADEPEFNGRKLGAWAVQLREDAVPRKRRAAVVALGQIAADHKDVLPEVLQHLGRALRNDASPAVREQAAVTIGQQKIEANAGSVLADLAESMRAEREPAVRREVAATLGRFGPAAKLAVQPLNALGRIGPDARTAAPDLLPLLKDAEKPVRQAAVFALGRVGPDDPAPVSAALVGVLSGTDADLRREALLSLSLLGDRSPDVVSAIARVLADKDAEQRHQAVLALARFGPAARTVEDDLKRTFQTDSDKAIRSSAAHALCTAYGTDAKSLIPLMLDRLKSDPDFEVRAVVAEELGALGADGRSAVSALREAQRDPQIKVREAAAAAIKRIERPSAIPRPER